MLTLFIVPPLILFPVNELSSSINVPPVKSNILPIPTYISVSDIEPPFQIPKSTDKLDIDTLSIVPPLILFPLIESLFKINFPSVKSNTFPKPTYISELFIKLLSKLTLSIVPPNTLLPLICLSDNNKVPFVKSKVELNISISVLLIVPPPILSPFIWLSDNNKVPPVRSKVELVILIFVSSILPPFIRTVPLVTSKIESFTKLTVPSNSGEFLFAFKCKEISSFNSSMLLPSTPFEVKRR